MFLFRFEDNDEFASIEIPLIHNFSGREIMFWVELYNQEKGVALGLKRTKVIIIKDEGVYCHAIFRSSILIAANY